MPLKHYPHFKFSRPHRYYQAALTTRPGDEFWSNTFHEGHKVKSTPLKCEIQRHDAPLLYAAAAKNKTKKKRLPRQPTWKVMKAPLTYAPFMLWAYLRTPQGYTLYNSRQHSRDDLELLEQYTPCGIPTAQRPSLCKTYRNSSTAPLFYAAKNMVTQAASTGSNGDASNSCTIHATYGGSEMPLWCLFW